MPNPFSAENVRKSVHATLDEGLAAIPEGKRSAVLIDATNERVQILLATKAGDNWQLSTGVAYDGEHVSGKVSIAGSWK